MDIISLFRWFNRHRHTVNIIAVPSLLLIVLSVGAFVYLTGGIKYVYSHSMYVPIVLAGMLYGTRGGIIVALMGGLILGPYMPISTATGEMQLSINWLYRASFFVLIGALSGIASDTVQSYLRHLHWLSRHDISTRLPNRMALMDDLTNLQHQSVPEERILMVLSLQSATELKAAFGHDVIEAVIAQTAERVDQVFSRQARIYRADTEEISALVSVGHNRAQPLLEKLKLSAQHPYLFEDIPIHVDTRIGYVQFREINEEPASYLQQAESALNAAHDRRLDHLQYQPSLKMATRDNMSLLAELMKALEQQQLIMHYQPTLDLHSGQVLSVEALMRWQHPQRGPIPPDTFIPCAEQSTLINLLTRFALEEAMQTARFFQSQAMPIPVAVNISAHNLCQPDFADSIFAMLAEHGLRGEYLELEVTESALVRDINHSADELQRLAAAGVTITVDDFGTGYSSLQYLHKLPISHLKLDQSFVSRLPDDQDAVHILQAAVSLAHKMKMKTIAEGVESERIMSFLKHIDCDIAQGYFISRPVEREQFIHWYQSHQGQLNWRQIS
jgi:predicted signal transduction protein with EAL and GGDEF domain